MSTESKPIELEGVKISESSSSSLDEKDLDNNGYVDVQDLIKSSADQQVKLTTAATESHSTDAISQLLIDLQKRQSQSGIDLYENVFESTNNNQNNGDDLIKLENLILQEPDSTTENLESEQIKSDLSKLAQTVADTVNNKQQEQPKVEPTKPKISLDKPFTTSTTTSSSSCSYFKYCKYYISIIMLASFCF